MPVDFNLIAKRQQHCPLYDTEIKFIAFSFSHTQFVEVAGLNFDNRFS